MNTERTNTLIADLTKGFDGIKPLPHPLVRILPWSLLSPLYVTTIVTLIGLRPDIYQKMMEPEFLFEIILMILISVSASIASAWLSIPDARGAGWLPVIPLTAFGLFFLWVSIRLITGESAHIPHIHWDVCIGKGLLLIAAPVAGLLFLMRRGATTRPVLMAAMNVLSVGTMGYAALRLVCYMDTIGHTGAFHLMPYIILGLVAGLFARKLYKW